MKIGIIGGTGLEDPKILQEAKEVSTRLYSEGGFSYDSVDNFVDGVVNLRANKYSGLFVASLRVPLTDRRDRAEDSDNCVGGVGLIAYAREEKGLPVVVYTGADGAILDKVVERGATVVKKGSNQDYVEVARQVFGKD